VEEGDGTTQKRIANKKSIKLRRPSRLSRGLGPSSQHHRISEAQLWPSKDKVEHPTLSLLTVTVEEEETVPRRGESLGGGGSLSTLGPSLADPIQLLLYGGRRRGRGGGD
jgi:hypothetical protein